MINAKKHRSGNKIPTIKIVDCPDCGKNRLGKYVNEDGTVSPASEETFDVRGEERFMEVCKFCSLKYQKSDQRYAKNNLAKLAKALKTNKGSDHKDFSLN
jgi:ssDNA-binding Zn-finger/Zn-ribbon topoisomerase 1